MEHAQPALIVLGRAPGDYLSPDSAWKAHQHYTECGCEAGCWARDANLVVPGRTFWETNKIGGLKFRVAPLLYTYPRRVDTLTIFAHSHLACICFGLTSAVTFTVIRNSLRVCYELNTNTNIVVYLSWSRTRIPQHGISNSFIPDKNRSLVCIRRVTVCQSMSTFTRPMSMTMHLFNLSCPGYPMSPLRIRLAVSVLLVGLFTLLILYCGIQSTDSKVHSDDVLRGDTSADNSSTTFFPWCSPLECTTGRWEPRQPPFRSMDEFRVAYANRQDHVWKGCRAPPDPSKNSSDQGKVDEDRLMKVMNWTWTPYIGKMKEWNAENFVIRLLKSPGGLILIGDSITQQHHHALGYLLGQSDFRFDIDSPELPMYNHKNVHHAVLKPDDPKSRLVMERANIPASRMKRPLFTMLEEHMLIDERDIRGITERLGASPSYHWYHDFQRVDKWEEFVANASRPREGEEDIVTEDTILLMNAGAHWSRHELAMLPPQKTDKAEQARVKETYKQMVKLVTSRISPISRLAVFYRSTSPGHPVCEKKSAPYANPPDAYFAEQHTVPRLKKLVDTADLKQQRARWDWDLFVPHNEIWRSTVARLMRERNWWKRSGADAGKLGARWVYMDLWEQALQRPDAHSDPAVDCLHWCLPSIFNEWTEYLYHLLFLETIVQED